MKMPGFIENINLDKSKLILKKQGTSIAVNIFRYVLFLSLSYVLIYPFLFMILNSLMSVADGYDATVTWVPKHPTLEHFGNAWKVIKIGDAFLRTIIYEIVTALVQFITCAVAAYGLARFKFKGRAFLSGMMIINILVPSMMIIIPSYVQFSNLDFLGLFGLLEKLIGVDITPNLIGTPLVFYLPALLSVGLKGGLFIYIYSQFFKGLPKELEEAAWIDGAGPWKTFLTIVLPSSGSSLITVLLFSIIWHWNDLFLAQMYMDKQTFATAIGAFNRSSVVAELNVGVGVAGSIQVPILLAGCLLFVLPLVIFYILIQRKFVASIATSGIVG